MNETTRAFIAVDLPASVKSAFTETISQLGRANLHGVRPINPNSLHLTVKFLGSVPVNKIPEVVNAVSEVIRLTNPFDLEIGPIGIFPSERFPRTISVCFTSDLNPIIQMYRRVDEAVANLGFIKEQRPFTPHLTLARLRNGTGNDIRRSAIKIANKYWHASGLHFQVNSVSFIKSTLSSSGAWYETIEKFTTRHTNWS